MDDKNYECLKRIGCIIENPYFYEKMTGLQNLELHCDYMGYHNRRRIKDVLELVNLQNIEGKAVSQYSLGMKQRLGIAFAILDNPDFIILDEPINGLDPIGISELRDLFKKLNEERNITILISSHILNELYQVANKFCIIEKGRVIKEITKQQLDEECSKCIVIKTTQASKAAVIIEEQLQTKNYKIIDNQEIRLYDYLENSGKVNKVLIKNDIDIISLYETGITLEDYFKTVIKEEK